MFFIGVLDRGIFRCVSPAITTDEVIITEERVEHIAQHHPGDFEAILPYMAQAVAEPDYILEDRPNTGLILKEVQNGSLRFQMVLRVHTASDEAGYKNSVLSAWRISENRWNRYLRQKKVLYKGE